MIIKFVKLFSNKSKCALSRREMQHMNTVWIAGSNTGNREIDRGGEGRDASG
jgi:hypothetical protein